MDEMYLKLSTKFTKGIIAKLITKTVLKKIGYKVDFQFNEIDIKTEDGKIKLHANVDAEISNDEFMKILRTTILD